MSRFTTIAALVLLVVVFVAPFPLASDRDWAWAPLAALVGLALAVQAIDRGDGSGASPPQAELTISIALVGAALLWAFVQLVPLGRLGYGNTLLSMVSGRGMPVPARISVDVDSGLTGIMRLMTYCGVFWLSSRFGREFGFARKLIGVLVVSAAIVTGYGFAMQIDNGSCLVFAIVKSPIGSSCAFSGTFVNAGNYATFAGIAGLACIAEIQSRLLAVRMPDASPRQRFRAQLHALSASGGVLTGALIVLLGGVFLSGSKGGSLCFLFASMATIALINAAQGRKARATRTAIVAFMLLSIVVLVLTGDMLVTRLIGVLNAGDVDRQALYSLSLHAIALRPWFGWGIGSFPAVYLLLQPAELRLYYDMAHNTYLESAIELGIPAAFLLLAGIALPAIQCLRGVFRRKRNAHLPALGFGVMLLLALNSLVDFSAQIPAVAIAASAVLGLGWSQSYSSRL